MITSSFIFNWYSKFYIGYQKEYQYPEIMSFIAQFDRYYYGQSINIDIFDICFRERVQKYKYLYDLYIVTVEKEMDDTVNLYAGENLSDSVHGTQSGKLSNGTKWNFGNQYGQNNKINVTETSNEKSEDTSTVGAQRQFNDQYTQTDSLNAGETAQLNATDSATVGANKQFNDQHTQSDSLNANKGTQANTNDTSTIGATGQKTVSETHNEKDYFNTPMSQLQALGVKSVTNVHKDDTAAESKTNSVNATESTTAGLNSTQNLTAGIIEGKTENVEMGSTASETTNVGATATENLTASVNQGTAENLLQTKNASETTNTGSSVGDTLSAEVGQNKNLSLNVGESQNHDLFSQTGKNKGKNLSKNISKSTYRARNIQDRQVTQEFVRSFRDIFGYMI
jgi:hypothetical protein